MKNFAMQTSTLVTLLSAGLLCCSRLSATAAELPGLVVPDSLGVCIHFTGPRPGEMEMLAAAGFRWIRMDLIWSATEREKGKYDFSEYDRLLAALDAHKIRGYVDLRLLQPALRRRVVAGQRRGRAAFARWAAAAARHFRNRASCGRCTTNRISSFGNRSRT